MERCERCCFVGRVNEIDGWMAGSGEGWTIPDEEDEDVHFSILRLLKIPEPFL